ncbi:hypothetical protein C0992_005174 [Termitomyces sp. T32_za158]|nr:hypothetical protein C0992_005174 [Termitomyces sp. T32_za158]
MSADIANKLGIIYNPTIHLNMQSANSTIDRSLGLAKNVECMTGDLTFYLQIHILRSPTYDILLGRPFDVLARSVVKTLSNDETTLTIMDPNMGILDMSNDLSSYVATPKWKGVQVKKKYKPVALKTKPVTSSVSEDFRIEQKIIGGPLANMPPLTPNPPPFIPTGHFTDERRKQFLANHDNGFLTAAELVSSQYPAIRQNTCTHKCMRPQGSKSPAAPCDITRFSAYPTTHQLP